jgi:hypothetical protein
MSRLWCLPRWLALWRAPSHAEVTAGPAMRHPVVLVDCPAQQHLP